MSPKNAAIAAGYSPSTATSKASRLNKTINTMEAMRDAFEREGITDEYLAKHAVKGMNSKTGSIRHRYFNSVCDLTGRIIHDKGTGQQDSGMKIVIIYPPDYKPKEEKKVEGMYRP
jgi:hypothetical protein